MEENLSHCIERLSIHSNDEEDQAGVPPLSATSTSLAATKPNTRNGELPRREQEEENGSEDDGSAEASSTQLSDANTVAAGQERGDSEAVAEAATGAENLANDAASSVESEETSDSQSTAQSTAATSVSTAGLAANTENRDFPAETKYRFSFYSPRVLQGPERFISQGFVSKLERYPEDYNEVVTAIGETGLRRHFEACEKSYDDFVRDKVQSQSRSGQSPAMHRQRKPARYGIFPVVSITTAGKEKIYVLTQVGFCHVENMYRFNDLRALKTDPFRGEQEHDESPWETATRETLGESAGLLDLRTVDADKATIVHPSRRGGYVFVLRIGFENELDLFQNFLPDFDSNNGGTQGENNGGTQGENIFGLALEPFEDKRAAGANTSIHVPTIVHFTQGAQFTNCMQEMAENIPHPEKTVWLRRQVSDEGRVCYVPGEREGGGTHVREPRS
jgi:hypothetical protein